ncbi:MAG: MipA/OmpV family protein [Oligoflexales bacterium]
MDLHIKVLWYWALIINVCPALPAFCSDQEGLALKEFGVGLLYSKVPDYRGTKHLNHLYIPFPYVIYRGKVLDIDDEGVKGILYKSELWELDLGYAGTLPVYSKNIEARKGMEDLDPTAQLGPQLKIFHLNYENLRIETRMPLRLTLSFGPEKIGYQGLVFDPYILIEFKIKAKNFDLSWSHFFGPIYASQEFNAFFYDVEASDATEKRLVYASKGGYSGYKYTSSMSGWRGHWGYGVFFRYDSIRSSVFYDSPLVETQLNITSGLGLIYLVYSESKF